MASIFGRKAIIRLRAELLREHPAVMIVARIVHADECALLLVDDDARLRDRRKIGIRELAAEARIRDDAAHVVVAGEDPRAPSVPQAHRENRLRRSRLRVLRRRLQGISAAERKARQNRVVARNHRHMVMIRLLAANGGARCHVTRHRRRLARSWSAGAVLPHRRNPPPPPRAPKPPPAPRID
jgi:hypothetical protein